MMNTEDVRELAMQLYAECWKSPSHVPDVYRIRACITAARDFAAEWNKQESEATAKWLQEQRYEPEKD